MQQWTVYALGSDKGQACGGLTREINATMLVCLNVYAEDVSTQHGFMLDYNDYTIIASNFWTR